MQPDAAGAAQGGEEQAFTAEQGRLDVADQLDVVVDAALESDDATGVDPEGLANCERALVQGAAGVDESETVTGQALHDEALAAKQAGAEPALKGDADAHAPGGAQEGVLLSD